MKEFLKGQVLLWGVTPTWDDVPAVFQEALVATEEVLKGAPGGCSRCLGWF